MEKDKNKLSPKEESMSILRESIHNYAWIYILINALELFLGLLFCAIPTRKRWQDYIVLAYGGVLLGMIPAFYLSESVACMLLSCLVLSFLLIAFHYQFQDILPIPVFIIFFKIVLLFGVTLFYPDHLEDKLEIFIISLFISVFCFIAFCYASDLEAKKLQFFDRVFGVTELCGALFQFYRMDYSSFDKVLQEKRESVSFFLYLLKVDYWIFEYQYLFVLAIFLLLVLYFIGKKFLSGAKGLAE